MAKYFIYIIALLYCHFAKSQELNVKFTVNPSRANTTVDRKIFTTLQNQLNNFVNNRKWTTDTYKPNERIECGFLLNIDNIVEANVYKATLIIQAARPVHGSSYQSALVNFQDADFTFKYIEFQPIEFNENRVQGSEPLIGNLSAVVAFYVYTILGLDYDSFSPKGGEKYYQKAQNIINNAPEGSGISGWKLFEGLRNRYWLNENLVNPKFNLVHDVFYSYYRAGLDKLNSNEVEARNNILQSLTQLQAVNQENSNSFIIQFFMQNRADELIGIFKKATPENKQKAIDLLSKLDVANAQRYKESIN